MYNQEGAFRQHSALDYSQGAGGRLVQLIPLGCSRSLCPHLRFHFLFIIQGRQVRSTGILHLPCNLWTDPHLAPAAPVPGRQLTDARAALYKAAEFSFLFLQHIPPHPLRAKCGHHPVPASWPYQLLSQPEQPHSLLFLLFTQYNQSRHTWHSCSCSRLPFLKNITPNIFFLSGRSRFSAESQRGSVKEADPTVPMISSALAKQWLSRPFCQMLTFCQTGPGRVQFILTRACQSDQSLK